MTFLLRIAVVMVFSSVTIGVFAEAVDGIEEPKKTGLVEREHSTEESTRSVRSVVDATGNTVQLQKPATRVVALAPHIVENVFSIGAETTLVGAVDYSDYPEAAKKIPRVGGYSAISIEAIVGLKPDLILAWHSGNSSKIVSKLRALGYPVYTDELHTVEDIGQALRDYGVLLNKEEQAVSVAEQFEQRIATLRRQNDAQQTVSVFYQVWNEPLQTLNGEHLISEVIRMCGGRNVFSDSKAIAPLVSVESVIASNPEVIVASGMGEARPDWLDVWYQYSMIDAVKSNNIVHIHPDILQRHTLRIYDGAIAMCQALAAAR